MDERASSSKIVKHRKLKTVSTIAAGASTPLLIGDVRRSLQSLCRSLHDTLNTVAVGETNADKN